MTKASLLQHVAIIPDGNRRWARKRGLPGWRGHLEAAKRIEEIAKAAIELNIKYLTIWGGSYDNLTKRSRKEIAVLNQLYSQLAKQALQNKEIHQKQVRIKFIGEWPRLLNKGVADLIKRVEKESAGYKNYYQTYLIGYNGDREMLDAVSRLVKGGSSRVNEQLLKSLLWTGDLPPVDLIIRTGGEPHLSAGFMMWHTRNSQLYFTEKFWPDFDKKEFIRALEDYARRERRFGR